MILQTPAVLVPVAHRMLPPAPFLESWAVRGEETCLKQLACAGKDFVLLAASTRLPRLPLPS